MVLLYIMGHCLDLSQTELASNETEDTSLPWHKLDSMNFIQAKSITETIITVCHQESFLIYALS